MSEHERTDRRSLNNSTISPNSSTCNCRCSTQLHRSRPFQLIILCTTLHGVNGSMNPLKSARILSAGCRREPAHICHLGLIEVSQLKFCHKDIGLELWLLRNWKHARARNLSIDQKPSHILLFVVLNYVEILSLGERVEQGATAPFVLRCSGCGKVNVLPMADTVASRCWSYWRTVFASMVFSFEHRRPILLEFHEFQRCPL